MANYAMTRGEREAFLADTHVAMLAVDDSGRGPFLVPVWYWYRPGGEVHVVTGGASRKVALLRKAGRASLCVQTETPPYKYAMVEGPVVVLHEQRDDLAMASRYLGPALGKWYAENNPSTSESVVVRLTPEHWLTCDFGRGMG